MKLLAMRDLNVQDPLPTLGRKVEPLAPATPNVRPTEHPSVFEKPDGKLETWIPENERVAWKEPDRRGKSVYNYFVQAAYEGKSYFEQEYMLKPYHEAPYILPGSNLHGKRPQMRVIDDLVSTDFSAIEERVIAAWYAKYKELCK
jgi:hypothetical protein